MSTISCGSCGMQYDGSGLQPGVQFQCTQCGSMVQVGAAKAGKVGATKARAAGGPARAGGAKAGARGPARAGGPRPAGPARGGQQGGQQQERPGYGAPRKSSNAGLFVGLGVGAVVLVLIVVVVISTSGPSPQDHAEQRRKDAAQAQRDEIEKRNAETRAAAEALQKPQTAAMAMAPSIEAALKNSDASALEAMFDWQVYARYNDSLVKSNPDYLFSALICVGSWVKDDAGKYKGWEGKAAHGADGLRDRVMFYIKEFYFGQADLAWDKPRTEAGGAMKLEVGSQEYIGIKVFIAYKGSSGEKEFWVGAPRGSDAVKILNLFDKSATKNLQGIEAKNERVDNRDPTNPDRDPRNPGRDPVIEDTPPDADLDANLPEMKKTGAMPTVPALVNAINEVARGNNLNTARLEQIRGEPSAREKKATMGALIDLLIDAQNKGDRTAKLRISSTLWNIWKGFVPANWRESQMVYTMEGFSTQSGEEMPIRRWLQVHAEYPAD